VLAMVCSIPLGTTASEICFGAGTVLAAWLLIKNKEIQNNALAGPWGLIACGWLVMSLTQGVWPTLSLGRIWATSPIIILPVLLRYSQPISWSLYAGFATIPTLLVTLLQFSGILVSPTEAPSGLFSHHLTMVYALFPIACVLWGMRYRLHATIIGMSLCLTGALGFLIALLSAFFYLNLTQARSTGRKLIVCGLGMIAGLVPLALLEPASLYQRAVLWTAGLRIVSRGGIPAEQWRETVDPVHHIIDPGFFFPHHSHDSAIQLLAETGPISWVAIGWALYLCFQVRVPWFKAMVFGLCVASFTQDLIGDLEVARSITTWLAIGFFYRSAFEKQSGTVYSGTCQEGSSTENLT
jgi:hypothetical protein